MLILLPESAITENGIKCKLTETGDGYRNSKSVAINPKNINLIIFDEEHKQTAINYRINIGKPAEYICFIYTGGDCVQDLTRILNHLILGT